MYVEFADLFIASSFLLHCQDDSYTLFHIALLYFLYTTTLLNYDC